MHPMHESSPFCGRSLRSNPKGRLGEPASMYTCIPRKHVYKLMINW